MTDNDIIKALEICGKGIMFSKHDCKKCPYYTELNCETKCKQNALDLINRQKADIERLKAEIKEKTETIVFLKDQAVGWSIDFCNLKKKVDTAKSEAITEFKKLTYEACAKYGQKDKFNKAVFLNIVDQIAKELKGEQE